MREELPLYVGETETALTFTRGTMQNDNEILSKVPEVTLGFDAFTKLHSGFVLTQNLNRLVEIDVVAIDNKIDFLKLARNIGIGHAAKQLIAFTSRQFK